MRSQHYEQVVHIFNEAADLEGEARSDYLDLVCKGDERLRRDVERMLDQDRVEDDVFDEERMSKGRELLAGAMGMVTSHIPEAIGPYRIIKEIGRGGMGAVYLAEQDKPRRLVALKMIRAGLISTELLKRFRFEAEVLGRLQHPGIAQIYQAGEVDTSAGRLPYFAMEYIEGTGLKHYVKENSLTIEARCELVARICDAVDHAHEKGVVHRDLKPDNVFVVKGPETPSAGGLSDTGRPKVLDFGVARAMDADIQITTLQTDADRLVGTLTYMSPEQAAADSRSLDRRSDIYALGSILYELLAERPPFDLRHKPIPEAARIVREEEPTRLAAIRTEFRGDMDTITCKAMEKDPDRRYASAAELAADLRRSLAHEPITAHPPSTFYQFRKLVRRHKGLAAGLTLAALILVAGTVTSLSFAIQALKGKNQAMVKEAEARRDAYRLNISTADAWGESHPLTALECLDAVPPEYRGWEWHHLIARINSHISECRVEDSVGTMSEHASSRDAFSRRSPPGVFCSDGEIRLIDLESKECRAVFNAPGGLTAPHMSPRGTLLAAACRAQRKLMVWDVETGERLLDLSAPADSVSHVCFTQDDALMAWCSRKEGVTVVETATGRVRFQTDPYPTDARMAVFSSDGSRLAVVGGNSGGDWCDGGIFFVHIYSREGERLAQRSMGDGACAISFSPDGRTIAIGHFQRMIGVYDSVTLERSDFLFGHTGPLTALVFSPDGA